MLQMEAFRKSFGRCKMVPDTKTGRPMETCHLGATAQSVTAISVLFTALGAGLSGFTGQYLGRRGVLQAGCLVIAIGAAGQCATAGSYASYNVCKCISCVGIGHVNAGGPLYGVEAVSPQRRGTLVSLYTVGLAVGILLSSSICYGTSTMGSNWEWRTPILLQIPLAGIYALGLMLFPESPRWLLTRGKEAKARSSFARFYRKDPQSAEVTAQIREVKTYIEFEKSVSSTTSWTELFHRSYLRRTLISFLVAMSSPFSGVSLIGNYAAVFFAANGVSQPFLIQVYLGVCGLVGSLAGPWLIEALGRRLTSLIGMLVMSSCMLIFSAVASGIGADTEVARSVLISFLCIWFFTFAACISSTHWVVGAEVHSIRMRTYGQAASVCVANVCNFAAAFWTPYMINPTAGNMGTNVGYFYFGLDIILFVLFVLYLPETGRLSLEQIDDLFVSARKAWKTSIGRNKRIARGEAFDIAISEHDEARRRADAWK